MSFARTGWHTAPVTTSPDAPDISDAPAAVVAGAVAAAATVTGAVAAAAFVTGLAATLVVGLAAAFAIPFGGGLAGLAAGGGTADAR